MAIESGNAHRDGMTQGGWLFGSFIDQASSLRRTDHVEIKWHRFRAGDARRQVIDGDPRTAVCLLVSGRLRISFEGGDDVVLATEGDYATWQGVGHTWQAEQDGLAVVVRWPSTPGFSSDIPPQAG